MAIYNGRILMRKGNEADFDAEKLMSGEWAVSLDKGIVRICLQAGQVIRMATYEAFEEDMKQIEAILLECQTIEEAVQRINTEINAKVDAVVEYVGQAKTYRDEAKTFRDEAEAFKNQAGEIAGIDIATTEKAGIVKPDGETLEVNADGTMRVIGGGGVSDYSELENKPSINGTELNGNKTLNDLGIASATELEKTNTKVNTIIEKAELGIKETASGEEIHLTDSAEGKAVEFALYGKAKQNTTSGKNLLDTSTMTMTMNGITYTVNNDGSVTANGTATGNAQNTIVSIPLKAGDYILSGGKSKTRRIFALVNGTYYDDIGNGIAFSVTEDTTIRSAITINAGEICSNEIFYPMIRLASITDDTYEPYTNGASPNPSYPQEIEVSGESYNLLENTATSQTINGVEFVVNEDKSVTANGTATANGEFLINNTLVLDNGTYILSGCPSGGSANTYRLRCTMGIDSSVSEFGDSLTITKTSGENALYLKIDYSSGVVFDNLTFYPMIRKASVKNDRYMPYGKGSVEVKSVGKNLFKNTATSQTIKGVKFVVNEDGSITADGTASANAVIEFKLEKAFDKDVIISGCPSNGSTSTYTITAKVDGAWGNFDTGNGFTIPKGKVINQINVAVYSGYTANNLTFYPMIRLATDTDDTYEPYKETTATIPTPNGLAGIPVSSGGNYTDSNGQQWICDEIVKFADGSGEKIEWIKHYSLAVADMNNSEDYPGWKMPFTDDLVEVIGEGINRQYIDVALNIGQNVNFNTTSNNKAIFLSKATYGMTQTEWKTNYPDLVVDIYIARKEPIHTPLTAEEIAEIEKLHTFYPVTNISNDADCGMSVTYYCDSKNYIDKKISELATAIVNNI